MEYFFVLLGFGFVLICLIPVILLIGILGYSLHITVSKDKKIEVAPTTENFNSNTIGKD